MPPAATLRCAHCGEPLRLGRAGAWIHRSRGVVAACDLDSDHVPVPDWAALGEIACRRCGRPAAAAGGAFAHVDPALDADHQVEPDLPAG
jgi:hypothetical protein